jgi:Holliday junction resolvase
MSKRSKGDRYERECKNVLKEAGWKVYKKTNNKWDSGDIWECFDVLAAKKGEKPLFIQVKSNRSAGALKQLSEASFLNREHMDIQVWLRHDRQGWRIKKLGEDGWIQPLDEREKDCRIGEKVVELYSQK